MNMVRSLIKRTGAFVLVLCLLLTAAGCQTTTLDGGTGKESVVSEEVETAQAEESSAAEEIFQDASADDVLSEASDADMMDVDSVDQTEDEDLSKYEEKKTTETVNGATDGAGTDLVTYSDGNGNSKDEYQTEPVPEGEPNPVEPEDVTVDKSKKGTCTLLIECGTVLNNMDKVTDGKEKVIPDDGVIYAKKKVTFYEGESVFDVLLRETKNNRIQMEYSFTPMYNSNYIKGINNLYEFDCGELSGWNYIVNGWSPNYGCSRYIVKEGDAIEWRYTCDLGRDL